MSESKVMTVKKDRLLAFARKYGLVTVENVFSFLKELIEQAEIVYKGGGAAKRAAVLEVMRIIIRELPDSDDKNKLLELLDGPIPDAIDLAVAVANSSAFKSCWRALRRWSKKSCTCCC